MRQKTPDKNMGGGSAHAAPHAAAPHAAASHSAAHAAAAAHAAPHATPHAAAPDAAAAARAAHNAAQAAVFDDAASDVFAQAQPVEVEEVGKKEREGMEWMIDATATVVLAHPRSPPKLPSSASPA